MNTISYSISLMSTTINYLPEATVSRNPLGAYNLKMATTGDLTAADLGVMRLSTIRKELAEDRQKLIEKEADFHTLQERFRQKHVDMQQDHKRKGEELQASERKITSLERENQDLRRSKDHWQRMHQRVTERLGCRDAMIAELEQELQSYQEDPEPEMGY
jgi:septal ring factor EnvC (AmiA/AmiB activator)